MTPNDQTPQKGDIIINPLTQRPVKVGSRTWLQLVKKGIVSGIYKKSDRFEPDNSVFTPTGSDRKGQQVRFTNQRYRKKTVCRGSRKPRGISKKNIAKLTSKVVTNNIDALISSGDNFDEALEELLLIEMMKESSLVPDELDSIPDSERRSEELERLKQEELEIIKQEDETVRPPVNIPRKRGRPKGSKNQSVKQVWTVKEPIDDSYEADSERQVFRPDSEQPDDEVYQVDQEGYEADQEDGYW